MERIASTAAACSRPVMSTSATAGTGSFTHSGGTNSVSNTLYVGFGGSNSGAYNLSGSGLLSAPFEYIGNYSGTGSVTHSGGTNSVSVGLVLAQDAGSSGTYNLNGGLLTLGAGGITQGFGSAAFNFGGGTLGATGPWSSSMNLNLTGSGGASTIDTTGGNISLSGNLLGSGTLNKVGPGTLSLSGTNSVLGSLTVNGGVLQIPSGSLTAATEYVGTSGNGNITQTGGTNAITGTLYITTNGSYNLSGGLLIATSIVQASASAGPDGVARPDVGPPPFNPSGGTLEVSLLAVPTNLASLGSTTTFNCSLSPTTVTSQISGPGNLNKTGALTLTLSNANTYTGSTSISQGTLDLAVANAAQDSTLVVSASNGLAFTPGIGTFNIGGLAGNGADAQRHQPKRRNRCRRRKQRQYHLWRFVRRQRQSGKSRQRVAGFNGEQPGVDWRSDTRPGHTRHQQRRRLGLPGRRRHLARHDRERHLRCQQQ